MTTILFLDIDGVLLPGRMLSSDWNRRAMNLENPAAPWAQWLSRRGRACATELCPQVVAGLNTLLTAVDARMVLISTWREAIGCQETRWILSTQGVADQWHDDFAAPWTGSKGDDILAWLRAHPEVEQWAVLDDEMVWAPWGEENKTLTARHVRPDFHDGVTVAHWAKLMRLLQPAEWTEPTDVRTIITHRLFP